MFDLDGLDQIPWNNLAHAYGPADDVPELLRAMQTAPPDLRGEDSPLWQLFGNIYHQGTVYEATSYAVPYLIGLAADAETPDRIGILSLLASIADGSSYLDVHEELLRHSRARGVGTPKFEQEKRRELAWVARAHEAVMAGFDTYLEMTSESSDVRFATANVLARLRSRVEIVGPLLRRMLAAESRSKYRAGLFLLLGEVSDRSAEALAVLTEAASQSSVPERRASALSLSRLNLPELPVVAREAIVEAIFDNDLDGIFDELPWDVSDSVHRWTLLESVRSNCEDVTLRLIDQIEKCELGSETVYDMLTLLFPVSDESPPLRAFADLTPLQRRAVRALVNAMDQGARISPIELSSWGFPDTERELRNLAAGRPRTVIDMRLPLLGHPEDPRTALVPGTLKPGDKIHHRHFGLGVVTHVDNCGRETKLTVQFEEEGEKLLGLPSDGSPIGGHGNRIGFWYRIIRDWFMQRMR
jgi:hypothetical protein